MENKAVLKEPSKETYGFKSKTILVNLNIQKYLKKTCFTWSTQLNPNEYGMTFNKKKEKKRSHRLNHLMTFLYSWTKPAIYISHHQKNEKNCYSII